MKLWPGESPKQTKFQNESHSGLGFHPLALATLNVVFKNRNRQILPIVPLMYCYCHMSSTQHLVILVVYHYHQEKQIKPTNLVDSCDYSALCPAVFSF